MCAWIARRRGIPYIVRPLGTLSPYTFANRKRWLKLLYFRLLTSHCSSNAYALHFTAPQEVVKAGRQQHWGHTSDNPHPSKRESQSPSAREPATIVFMSRLHPVKGLDLLLRALGTNQGEYTAVKLVVAGSGDPKYELSLRNRVEELGLSGGSNICRLSEGDSKKELLSKPLCLLSHRIRRTSGSP